MGSDFDDNFSRIFARNNMELRHEIMKYVEERFISKKKIEEVYRKLKNARKKTVEKIVQQITMYHDIIITENLQVKKMLEKKNNHKKLRKEITSATFSEIIRILKYKSLWLNKIFIQVSPYYPSSQICSKCGLEIERDYNASINILNEGLRCYNN